MLISDFFVKCNLLLALYLAQNIEYKIAP